MRIFQNATIKLALWYLLILMSVSLIFSIIIFQITRSEVETGFEKFISRRISPTESIIVPASATKEQTELAVANLIASLGYLNLIVLVCGGAGAYFLARQTLKPIENAHEVQSRFVSNASHQLRTPLAIIKAETELALADSSASKTELRNILSSNLEEVNHLTKLSSMLLNLSKNDDLMGESLESVDLQKLIRSIVKKQSIDKRTKISSGKNIQIVTHQVAIKEVLNILIDNAIKHSPKNSPIKIDLAKSKNQIDIIISNQGKELSREQRQHIFERFYRTNDSKGYGLGLPLAKQLTASLGGELNILDSRTNQTTFLLKLPLKFS